MKRLYLTLCLAIPLYSCAMEMPHAQKTLSRKQQTSLKGKFPELIASMNSSKNTSECSLCHERLITTLNLLITKTPSTSKRAKEIFSYEDLLKKVDLDYKKLLEKLTDHTSALTKINA